LSHEEVVRRIPEEWILEAIIEERKVYNTQIREIVQDGTNIRLRMNRSSSLKIREPQIIHKGQPSKHSVDNSTINLDLRGLDNITPIGSKPLYTKSKKI